MAVWSQINAGDKATMLMVSPPRQPCPPISLFDVVRENSFINYIYILFEAH